MRAAKLNFSLTTASLTQELPCDLSRYPEVLLALWLTTADTAAGDKLSVKLQCSYDGIGWHDRAVFADLLGTLSPSATAPVYRELRLTQLKDPAQTAAEEAVTPSGSADGAALTAGTVLDGPFPGKRRDSTGRGASWRLVFTITNGTTPVFAGRVELHVQETWTL